MGLRPGCCCCLPAGGDEAGDARTGRSAMRGERRGLLLGVEDDACGRVGVTNVWQGCGGGLRRGAERRRGDDGAGGTWRGSEGDRGMRVCVTAVWEDERERRR